MIIVITLLLILIYSINCNKHHNNGHQHPPSRLYLNQFPLGSEHLILPPILCLSVYYGKIKYPHMNLYLESLRINTRVYYELINIVDDHNDKLDILQKVQNFNLTNFHITFITSLEFRERVKDKLNFDIAFNDSWSYKVGTDYKPTLAYLFPEIVDKPLHEGRTPYKYWAYTGIVNIIIIIHYDYYHRNCYNYRYRSDMGKFFKIRSIIFTRICSNNI